MGLGSKELVHDVGGAGGGTCSSLSAASADDLSDGTRSLTTAVVVPDAASPLC